MQVYWNTQQRNYDLLWVQLTMHGKKVEVFGYDFLFFGFFFFIFLFFFLFSLNLHLQKKLLCLRQLKKFIPLQAMIYIAAWYQFLLGWVKRKKFIFCKMEV